MISYDSYLDQCIDEHYADDIDIEDFLLYHCMNDDCLNSIDICGISDDADEYFYSPEELALERENAWRESKQS